MMHWHAGTQQASHTSHQAHKAHSSTAGCLFGVPAPGMLLSVISVRHPSMSVQRWSACDNTVVKHCRMGNHDHLRTSSCAFVWVFGVAVNMPCVSPALRLGMVSRRGSIA